jgi:SAM-dependent methyltransferase
MTRTETVPAPVPRPSQSLYQPTRSEKARQDFVLSLKFLANGPAQQRVRAAYRDQIEPALMKARGAPPLRRQDVEQDLARSQAFRHWAVLAHRSQSMMWDSIEATTRRMAPAATQRLLALRAAVPRHGSLELDPELAVPPPIGNTEIHRQLGIQPGGYHGAADPDLTPGLRYIGASQIYAPGKGNFEAAGDDRGAALARQVRARFPDLQPTRILDLGCGIGMHAQSVARAFPQAEYHAVDVAAGLLRFAHLLAEERGVPILFYQRDAARTGFPDGHFDLIISNILFHETNSARLPQILRECRRLLRPGGAMLHADVGTQPSRLGLADQVMNDWQVRWNGEPFWTAFAQYDMREEVVAAGFDPARTFAEHVAKSGAAPAYVFGARA